MKKQKCIKGLPLGAFLQLRKQLRFAFRKKLGTKPSLSGGKSIMKIEEDRYVFVLGI